MERIYNFRLVFFLKFELYYLYDGLDDEYYTNISILYIYEIENLYNLIFKLIYSHSCIFIIISVSKKTLVNLWII